MKRHKIEISSIGSEDYLERRIKKSLKKISSNPNLNFWVALDKYFSLLRLSILNKVDYSIIHQRARDYVSYSILDLKRINCDIEMIVAGEAYNLLKSGRRQKNINNRVFGLLNLCEIFEFEKERDQLFEIPLPQDETPFSIVATKYLKTILERSKNIRELIGYKKVINNYSEKGTTIYVSLSGEETVDSEEVSVRFKILRKPILDLYNFALDKEEILFNKTLEEYSIAKREYIGKHKQLDLVDYWIDFDAMGATSFAKSMGLEVKYKSEYIPILK